MYIYIYMGSRAQAGPRTRDSLPPDCLYFYILTRLFCIFTSHHLYDVGVFTT